MAIRILVVDDEWEKRKDAYELLEVEPDSSERFELVIPPKDLPLEFLQKKSPTCDVALVDIFLHEGAFRLSDGGPNVLDVLHEAHPKMPIFLSSDKWHDSTAEIYQELAPRKWIAGALSPEDLKDKRKRSRIRYEIIIEVQRTQGATDLWLPRDEDLNILHCSDLQFGGSWIGSDAIKAGKRIIADVVNAIGADREGRPTPIHLLALTGDLAEKARPPEFESAARFISELRQELDIPQSCCFVVPGNHDVNMSLASSYLLDYIFCREYSLKSRERNPCLREEDSDPDSLKQYGLAAFYDFHRAVTGRDDWALAPGSSERIGMRRAFVARQFSTFGLNLVCINTVGAMAPDQPFAVTLPAETVIEIESELRLLKQHRGNALNMIMLHHSPWKGLGDAYLSEDGDDFLRVLSKLGDALFLFGHIHRYAANVRSLTEAVQRQALYIASPTLSLRGDARAEDSLRGFSLLRLKRNGNWIHEAQVERYEYKDRFFQEPSVRVFQRTQQFGWQYSATPLSA